MQHSFRALALAFMAPTVFGRAVMNKGDCTDKKDGKSCATPIEGCTNVTVIEDVATGWKDGCKDLTQSTTALDKASCEAQCKSSVNCSVWQWSGEGETSGGHCYSGVPDQGCRTRSDFVANAGQRLQHGAVLVTGTALGMEVMNLMAFQMDAANTAGAVIDAARCKQACYTDTTCTVWQYGQKSGAYGCWMEHLPGNKQTTIDKDTTTNTFAKEVEAGEFIAHYCPVAPPKEDNIWLWLGPLLAAIALLLIGLIAYLLRKPKKVKKTRAVKIAPKQEEAVPLWIPQPTVLIPQTQPTVVYQQIAQPTMVSQPQVTYAAPTTTYAAPQAVTAPLLQGGSVMIR